MSFNPSAVTPLIFVALIAWIYYRRIRSSFGRQAWSPLRAGMRLGLLGLVMLSLLAMAIFVPHVGLGIAAGATIGALLGLLALQHTHAEVIDGGRFYTPNPWIGAALSILLLGRLAWRMSSGGLAAGAAQAGQNANPITLAIAAALVGYYLVSLGGLALRMRHLAPADPV